MVMIIENNKIIIVILLIIIVLLVILGMMLFNSVDIRTTPSITVTSNVTLYEEDYCSLLLSDVNATPLVNQTVNITLVDANGSENHQQVTTDDVKMECFN